MARRAAELKADCLKLQSGLTEPRGGYKVHGSADEARRCQKRWVRRYNEQRQPGEPILLPPGKPQRLKPGKVEAAQVGAMALRFIIDVVGV